MSMIKKPNYMRTVTQAFLLLTLLLLSACGGDQASSQDPNTASPPENPSSADDFSDAIQQAQQVIQKNNQLQAGQPLDMQQVKAAVKELPLQKLK